MIRQRSILAGLVLGSVFCCAAAAPAGSPVPPRLQGSWRIARILPTRVVTCWDEARARQLIGSTLTYRAHTMRWRGGEVPLQDAFTRQVTADEFVRESGSGRNDANLIDLGIHARVVTEIDLQHEDADITGATTEVPGDTVLLAGPNRIVVSACNVFYEATRVGAAP